MTYFELPPSHHKALRLAAEWEPRAWEAPSPEPPQTTASSPTERPAAGDQQVLKPEWEISAYSTDLRKGWPC